MKKVLLMLSALLVSNVAPVNAALYIEWIDPLNKLYIPPIASGGFYEASPDQTSSGVWYDLGYNDTGYQSGPLGTFVVQSDSGQSGFVQIQAKTRFSVESSIDELNAINTAFNSQGIWRSLAICPQDEYSGFFCSSGYESLPSIDLNRSSYDLVSSFQTGGYANTVLFYSQTDAILTYLEIERPYIIESSIVGGIYWVSSDVLDQNFHAEAFVSDRFDQSVSVHIVPEPTTMFLFSTGLLGVLARRRTGQAFK